MKNTRINPAKSKLSGLKQVCKLIRGHLVKKIAEETGAAERARGFTCWSHVVSLLHSQLSHSIGLNDACDTLQLNRGALAEIRDATPPSHNGLSHANKVRPAEMAEKLFWGVLDSLGQTSPAFLKGRSPRVTTQVANREWTRMDTNSEPSLGNGSFPKSHSRALAFIRG